jgi:hypothetical protein
LPLYSLSFFDLRLLIIPLVSLNFSYAYLDKGHQIHFNTYLTYRENKYRLFYDDKRAFSLTNLIKESKEHRWLKQCHLRWHTATKKQCHLRWHTAKKKQCHLRWHTATKKQCHLRWHTATKKQCHLRWHTATKKHQYCHFENH